MTQQSINPLPQDSLDRLFLKARSHNSLGGEIKEETLKKLYDLVKMGPTAANMSPARFVFVTSQKEKERLVSIMDEGNKEKTQKSPVTVIVGHDLNFYEKLPYLFPHTNAKAWFEDAPNDTLNHVSFQNATLQAGYLIMGARALGLDTGPMTGFDMQKASKLFFPNSNIKANMMINLGVGDHSKIFERSPRLPFEESGKII